MTRSGRVPGRSSTSSGEGTGRSSAGRSAWSGSGPWAGPRRSSSAPSARTSPTGRARRDRPTRRPGRAAGRLARLPPGAVVVDASRGGIVDHDALLELIESGHVRGAAIDVYATEPLPMDSRLRRSDRILLSPHAASVTREAIGRMFGLVGSNVRRAIAGEPIESVVNGVEPVVRRRAPASIGPIAD